MNFCYFELISYCTNICESILIKYIEATCYTVNDWNNQYIVVIDIVTRVPNTRVYSSFHDIIPVMTYRAMPVRCVINKREFNFDFWISHYFFLRSTTWNKSIYQCRGTCIFATILTGKVKPLSRNSSHGNTSR